MISPSAPYLKAQPRTDASKASVTLIAYFRNEDPDYEKLLQKYTEIMKKDNKGFYIKWFEPLTKSFENIPPGTGLAIP